MDGLRQRVDISARGSRLINTVDGLKDATNSGRVTFGLWLVMLRSYDERVRVESLLCWAVKSVAGIATRWAVGGSW